jgi:hypothetical protein
MNLSSSCHNTFSSVVLPIQLEMASSVHTERRNKSQRRMDSVLPKLEDQSLYVLKEGAIYANLTVFLPPLFGSKYDLSSSPKAGSNGLRK